MIIHHILWSLLIWHVRDMLFRKKFLSGPKWRFWRCSGFLVKTRMTSIEFITFKLHFLLKWFDCMRIKGINNVFHYLSFCSSIQKWQFWRCSGSLVTTRIASMDSTGIKIWERYLNWIKYLLILFITVR